MLNENFKKLELKTQEADTELLDVGVCDEFDLICGDEGSNEFKKLLISITEKISDHMIMFSERTQYYATNIQEKCKKI